MIHSKPKQVLMTLMPLLAIFFSFSSVFYQNWRRDARTEELAATDKEYEHYSKRYMELWRTQHTLPPNGATAGQDKMHDQITRR